MRCPRCGRELTPGKLTLVGTLIECQLCLGCNHLFLSRGLYHKSEPELESPPKALPGLSAPASESCPLTDEQEAEARKLLET